MIVAGIDEAGLGPLIGPLCVASAAVRLPHGQADDGCLPDVWSLLRHAVSRERDRTGRRLHVADSKKVFAGRSSSGLRELERVALSLSRAAGSDACTFDAHASFVRVTAPPDPWYACEVNASHPAACEASAVATAANALSHAARSAGVDVLPSRVGTFFERRYNDLCRKTRNKASVVQSAVAVLLDALLRDYACEPGGLLVVIDRQGGRVRYGPFLRQMFPDWALCVFAESDGTSTYDLSSATGRARIIFAEGGESLCLATAAASIHAKYVRERYMMRLNAFWAGHVPGLRPTAGYWTDGLRFAADTADARSRLGVADDDFLRER